MPELVEIKRIALTEPTKALALSPDQTMIMTGSATGIVRMWRLPEEVQAALNITGKPVCAEEPTARPIKEQLVKEIVAFTREPAPSIESDMLEDGGLEEVDKPQDYEDTYRTIHTVNFLPGGEPLTAAKGMFQAQRRMVQDLAWQNFTRSGIQMIDKNGGAYGFSSWMGWVPAAQPPQKKNVGLILLSNKRCKCVIAFGRNLLIKLFQQL